MLRLLADFCPTLSTGISLSCDPKGKMVLCAMLGVRVQWRVFALTLHVISLGRAQGASPMRTANICYKPSTTGVALLYGIKVLHAIRGLRIRDAAHAELSAFLRKQLMVLVRRAARADGEGVRGVRALFVTRRWRPTL